ncbi:hypothetical protein KEM55_003982 [Ascosphaera atra]|nr:hypothetical protein KEM55_003982 [Ascosphaera atra]
MSSNDEIRLVSSRKRHDGSETDTGTGTGSANLEELRYRYQLPDGHSNGDSSRNGNENASAAGTSSIYASSSRSSPLSTVNSSIASPAQLSPYLSTGRSPPNNPQQQAHAVSPSASASTTVGPELLQSATTPSLPSHTHTLTPHVHEVPDMTSAGPAMPSHTNPDGSGSPPRVDVIDLTNEDVSPPPLPPRQPGYDYRRPAVDGFIFYNYATSLF